MTTREHLSELKRVLNIQEYHEAGFKGDGVIVASVEDLFDGDHGQNVYDTVLTYAPNCKVISYNEEHPDTSATADDNKEVCRFPEFVDWCIENKVDIVTSSLNWMPDKEVEKEAIRKLYEHGIIFCNCAGNEGDENKFSNTKRTWQFDEEVICVSAYMHSTNGKFSWGGFNYGEAVDVLGCGRNCPTMAHDSNVVYSWSGTSSATPMIAGMLATYKSADKTLNSKNALNLIKNNYIPLVYNGREYKILVLPPLELALQDKGAIVEDKDIYNNPSEWAKESWVKATDKGITDGTNPQGNITREQLIVILDRLKLI